MRIAVVEGRTKLVRDSLAHDVAELSGGRFGPWPADVYERWAAFGSWARSAELTGGAPFETVRVGAPSPAPRQVFGIGLNYREHQIESGFAAPEQPLVFGKFLSSVAGPVGELALPSGEVDWEAEVAVVIGTRAHRVPPEAAWDHVAGITAAQDFSDRGMQMRPPGSPQFGLGKSYPGFTPLGPQLVTLDELPDRDAIPVECWINGVLVQSSTTADLIFPIPELIAYLSSVLPLLPGDVILTGTPSGVGMGRTPPSYLQPGDQVVTRVADLELRQTAVADTIEGTSQ